MKQEFANNKAVNFGGDLQVPECQKIMACQAEISKRIKEFVQSDEVSNDFAIFDVDDATQGGTKTKLTSALDGFERIHGHLDAIFSICRTRHYQMRDEDWDNLASHIKDASHCWRALGVPISPKFHILEDHLRDIVKHFLGVGGQTEGRFWPMDIG